MTSGNFPKVATALLLAVALFPLAVPAEGPGTRVTGTFPREFFGGGDSLVIMNPSGDSWVGVIWGTADQPVKNSVMLAASWTRTIGAAEVFNSTGKPQNLSKPLTVRSLAVHALTDIYEFNDTDGDGIASVVRTGLPVARDQLSAIEPVYRSVSLRQAWTRGPVEENSLTENGTVMKNWTFTLTAVDLPYSDLAGGTGPAPGDGVLDAVRLTFNIRVSLHAGRSEVPCFNITLGASGTAPTVNLTSAGTRAFNSTTFSARAKVDQEIEGWDVDPNNTAPGLVLESRTFLGWSAPPLSASWFSEDLVRRSLKGGGRIEYTPEGGKPQTADSSQDGLRSENAPLDLNETPRKLQARELSLADNWATFGRFSWVSEVALWDNSTSSARTGRCFYQVQGARAFSTATDRGTFTGVLLLGGLSYPGAWKVRHDPELGMDMGGFDIPEIGPPVNHPPTARIASPREGRKYSEASSIKLDGSPSSDPDSDPLTCLWMEGTKVLGNTTILSRRFQEGTHSIQLTVNDGRGGFNSTGVTFKVEEQKKQPGPGTGLALAGLGLASAAAALRRRRPTT